MEAYSPAVERALRTALAGHSPAYLAQLLIYYRVRQGPGLALVRAEYLRRGLPDPYQKPTA
ncbi:hypothetical protein DDQ68_00175 [Hymenobacter nivis]|uniref:Uncharacterized protein n=1 Tax=Hymenobacter nivis TaxID=1850093 RepID=A0A2Z3GI12_9BACT|nr:hypothetical protein DDQ68_00175 [Hymenobacter nivis]